MAIEELVKRAAICLGVGLTTGMTAALACRVIADAINKDKATAIVRNSEKAYFGRELTKKERIIAYNNKGFQNLVRSELNEKKLISYFDELIDFPTPY